MRLEPMPAVGMHVKIGKLGNWGGHFSNNERTNFQFSEKIGLLIT